MTTTLIKMPVVSFRRIENPLEKDGKKMNIAVVRISDLAADLEQWRKINPRDPSTTSGVAKKIAQSLESNPRGFFFKNRGITLMAERVEFDNKTNLLELELSDLSKHGMLDGGHTYRIIRNIIDEVSGEESKDFQDAYVKMEILEGFEDLSEVVDLVEARNTSTQVKDQSIEELLKHFEEIKKVLKDKPYHDRIAYKEIELADDGSKKDIDVKEILSYLTCFDVDNFDGKKHPIMAYSGKGAVVEHFKKNREDLKKFIPLLPEILELVDHIYLTMPDTYNKQGGKFGHLMGVVELTRRPRRQPVISPFLGVESNYSIPSAFIYPVLAALRNLVNCSSGKCNWKANPVKFYDELKDELVQRLGEQAKEFRNPNKLGKDNATWGRCYDLVELEVLKRKL